jgi:predicted kinase
MVRGKVEGFKLNDPLIPQDERNAATWLARTYFELARRYASGSGLLVVMSGVTGSGKSTVAQRLGALLAGTVFSSDVVRKQLAGLRPGQHAYEPFGGGIYSAEWTSKTYDELFRLAGPVLAAGGCAILDASFLHDVERAHAAATALRAQARMLLVECTAPREVILGRLATRESSGGVSDGRPEILEEQLARSEPVRGLPNGSCVTVDTSRSIDLIMEELWERI